MILNEMSLKVRAWFLRDLESIPEPIEHYFK